MLRIIIYYTYDERAPRKQSGVLYTYHIVYKRVYAKTRHILDPYKRF